MYQEWMSDPFWKERDRNIEKRIEEEIELEEKIFRISHPILAKLDDARTKFRISKRNCKTTKSRFECRKSKILRRYI